jgi:DNA repair protein RecO (recombination protein O)
LQQLGFAVSLDACVQCGVAAAEGSLPIYPLAGGYVCGRCAKGQNRAVLLAAGDRRLLLVLQKAGPTHAQKIKISDRQHLNLRRLMRGLWEGVFEKQLKSEPFILNNKKGYLAERSENSRLMDSRP